MKKVLLALAFAAPIVGFSQWKATNPGKVEVKEGKERIEAAGFYNFDQQMFKDQLANTPARFTNMPGRIISIPNAAGKLEKFEVWEASNFEPELQERYPDIRSYAGVGIDDPNAYLRFSLSPLGISTMTLRAGKSEFIEAYTTDAQTYIVFDSKKHRTKEGFECLTNDEENALALSASELVGNESTSKANNGVFKTFKLAQSCTGEYGQYYGGTVAGAMAGINQTLTRVNGVYEKDLAVQLILIANNDQVVYLDPNTDPYSPPSGMGSWPNQLENTLNSVIGFANYDIGHLYGRSGGGGNAGCIGCICNNGKGRGYTSPGTGGPEGDNFDIDYVAHEYGHQLGANHTFSFNIEGTGVNVEPGSGSTIMGYAGITSYNVQQHSDDYFTYRNLQQVQNNLANKPCAVNIPLTNQAPVVSAGSNYNIPKGTAFVLTGTATDADGDPMVYNWEQNNSGTNATTGANSRVGFTKNQGPNFRSNPHLTTPVRYMPRFDYVLQTDVTSTEAFWKQKWEAVTTVTRQFNFTFTARDNHQGGGQTNTAAMVVNVRDAGPFKITNPIQNQSVNIESGTMLVEWDVAGTDQTPINTANVRILLSVDNGATFTVVNESTPNDGSEVINLPAGTTQSSTCRVMIEAIGNIYYAVSRNFKLIGFMDVQDFDKFTVGIYPNPNNGQFFVKAASVAKGDVKMNIVDTAGRVVYTTNHFHNGGNFDQKYTVKLPTGVYMVNIETADNVTTEKLIIK